MPECLACGHEHEVAQVNVCSRLSCGCRAEPLQHKGKIDWVNVAVYSAIGIALGIFWYGVVRVIMSWRGVC